MDMDTLDIPLAWIKRDPKQMFIEMLKLDLRERGAFQTAFDLICIHGGEIEDDDNIVRYLSCRPKRWHSIRDKLIDLGMLYREGNSMLRSRFADEAYGFARKVVPFRTV
jgi:hypothetical protein